MSTCNFSSKNLIRKSYWSAHLSETTIDISTLIHGVWDISWSKSFSFVFRIYVRGYHSHFKSETWLQSKFQHCLISLDLSDVWSPYSLDLYHRFYFCVCRLLWNIRWIKQSTVEALKTLLSNTIWIVKRNTCRRLKFNSSHAQNSAFSMKVPIFKNFLLCGRAWLHTIYFHVFLRLRCWSSCWSS